MTIALSDPQRVQAQQRTRLAAIRSVVAIGDALNNETARFLLGQLDDALDVAAKATAAAAPAKVGIGEVYTYLRTHGGQIDTHDPDELGDLTNWINTRIAPAPAGHHSGDTIDKETTL